ncbi:hypothetical protein LTR51_008677 [Lithohypha guttulata]|nr:hypothetical protein LTR51_008677 [Lithohypha guttulata]
MTSVSRASKIETFAQRSDLILVLNLAVCSLEVSEKQELCQGLKLHDDCDLSDGQSQISVAGTAGLAGPGEYGSLYTSLELREQDHTQAQAERDRTTLVEALQETHEEHACSSSHSEDGQSKHGRLPGRADAEHHPYTVVSGNPSFVEMHVSATHLIEASKYFETLLAGQFQEACPQDDSSIGRIALEEVYAPAFTILMNIAHSRYWRLPERVDTEMLFELCMLIHMYDMHESAVLQTDLWFGYLHDTVSEHSVAHLHRWSFICYVLRKTEAFRAVTEILQRCHLQSAVHNIPLPPCFDGKVQQSRQEAVALCAQSLEAVLNDYGDTTEVRCLYVRRECDELTLGSLIRALRNANLYPPSTRVSMHTIDAIDHKLRHLWLRSYCSLSENTDELWGRQSPGKNYSQQDRTSECGCGSRIEAVREQLVRNTRGVSLQSVVPQ